MLTYDQNNIRLTNSLLTNKFEVELLSIELYNATETIGGKGTICQNDNGELILKFFSNTLRSAIDRIKDMCDRTNAANYEGQFIGDDECYSMKALDFNGVSFSCSKLYSYRPKENYTVFKLWDKLHKESSVSESRIVCIGSYQIPKSDQLDIRANCTDISLVRTEHIFQVDLTDSIRLRLSSQSDYLDVHISSSDTLDLNTTSNIISTLNFVFGFDIEPMYVSLKTEGVWFYPMAKKKKQTSHLSAPLSLGNSYGQDFFVNHKEMSRCYFNFISNEQNFNLQAVQKRIWSAGQSYPYILAVTLVAQIENIVKTYYYQYYKPNLDRNECIDIALECIKESDITRKDREWLGSILGPKKAVEHPNRSQINIKPILATLIKQQLLSNVKYADKWHKLRSCVAHGDSLSNTDDNSAEKEIIKLSYICINLYYELIFCLIGYCGTFSLKDYDGNRLAVYLPINLKSLGIEAGEQITCKAENFIVSDAENNIIYKQGEESNISTILGLCNKNVRGNYIVHSQLFYNGTSLLDLHKRK